MAQQNVWVGSVNWLNRSVEFKKVPLNICSAKKEVFEFTPHTNIFQKLNISNINDYDRIVINIQQKKLEDLRLLKYVPLKILLTLCMHH